MFSPHPTTAGASLGAAGAMLVAVAGAVPGAGDVGALASVVGFAGTVAGSPVTPRTM
jgi:hypothetical protein